jgi:putative transposase
MPRPLRITHPNVVYHVLNRANERARIFHSHAEYRLFRMLLREASRRFPVRVLAYCIMPNHWHLVLWPLAPDSVSAFMHWLTTTHVAIYRRHHGSVGDGHVYQGRFKCFAVQSSADYLKVMHYVEQNALRGRLAPRAELWRWSSVNERCRITRGILAAGPVPLPANWIDLLNQPMSREDLAKLRESAERGTPFGSDEWKRAAAVVHGVEQKLRGRGRPKRGSAPTLAFDAGKVEIV